MGEKTAVSQVNAQLRAPNLPHTKGALSSSFLCTIMPQSRPMNRHLSPYWTQPTAFGRYCPPSGPPTEFRAVHTPGHKVSQKCYLFWRDKEAIHTAQISDSSSYSEKFMEIEPKYSSYDHSYTLQHFFSKLENAVYGWFIKRGSQIAMHGHVPIITDTCKYHVSNISYYLSTFFWGSLGTRLCMAHASLVPGLAISLGTRL